MIKKEEILANINTEYNISREYLADSRICLCKYISDICKSMDLYVTI